MRNHLIITLLSILCFAGLAAAQKNVVMAAFDKHGIDRSILDPAIKQRPDDVAFDLKHTSYNTNGKAKVITAKYDPSKTGEERWTVLTVNDKRPSKSDISKFMKEHAKPAPNGTAILDASYKIEKETPDELVVSYMLDPATIPSEASFLADCRNHLTINLKSKRLEQLQTLNEKAVKIKILKATKLDLIIKYIYNEQLKRYLPLSENLVVIVRLLGQESQIETMAEYSGYKVVSKN